MKSTTLAWAIRAALITAACVQTSGFAAEMPASTDAPAATNDAQPQAASKDEKAANLETVTVTGIVGSLNKSIDAKRSETAIVDAVSAEDVGKFPDNNIAESLQRITGVEITRDGNGEGQYVTIRGLPTDFTYFTLNGLPVSSVSGAGTRSFDFSVLATDFISTLKVYKSSRADLDEGGIGGNVDVQTITPFGIGKERAVLSAKMQGDPGGYANRNYPDISGIYSNIFADGTFGVTVGFDWNKRFYLNENNYAMQNGWQWQPYCIDPTDPTNANGSCTGGTKTLAAQYWQLQNSGTKLDTKTGYLSAQWKPFDSTVVTLDGLYVHKTTDSQASTLIVVPSYPWGTTLINNNSAPPSFPTDTNGLVTRWDTPYTWTDARTDITHSVGQTKNFSLNVDTKLDNWEFSGTGEYSSSPTSGYDYYAQVGLGPGLGNVPNYMAGYQINPGGGPPQILLPSNLSGLPSTAWGSDEISPDIHSGGDEIKLLKADITRTFNDGPIQDIKFGVKTYRRELTSWYEGWYYNNNNTGAGTPFNTAFVQNPYGNLLEGAGGVGVNNLPFINYQLWLNQYFGGSRNNLVNGPNITDYGISTSDIVERGDSGYAMADFRFDNGTLPIYGNIGVRYQRTSTQIFYNGFSLNDPNLIFNPNCANNDPSCIRFKAPSSYTSQTGANHSFLPSLNVAADLRDDMVLRFSTSQTMSRPTLGYMNPAVSFDYTFFNISSGNPNLAPFKSTNYDLSYEWYFRPTSVLSVAVYDKEMTGFIQQVTVPYNFRGTPFNYTTYVNGSDAYVRGLEIDYKQVFDFLPGFWSGFGTEFNFTYSKGQQSAFNVAASGNIPAISRPASPFLGLTPRTTNLDLFYEKYGFSASVAVNKRASYLVSTDTVATVGGAELFNYINTRTFVDLHAAYSVNDHLKVFGDITNLTNKPITGTVYVNSVTYPGTWQYNGRRVDVGATYSF